jgi:UDP-glucose 4-epimerase
MAGPGPAHRSLNVGTGTGTSVLEIVEGLGEVIGRPLDPVLAGRRAGDPAEVVADVTAVRRDLGWSAQESLRSTLESAWAAWRTTHAL